MAPLPTTPLPPPPPHTFVGREIPPLWSAYMAENKYPTAAMCLAIIIVTLLVVALLLCTGRRWQECNGSGAIRQRICQHCRDVASARAARLRSCQADSVELSTQGAAKKDFEGPAPWHGSNVLNTSWGWMI
ncbi:hypothetical protein G3M48_002183 [Beauveria asiatica]|uniref:Uncharacterized protein n=1 Tax=Beauveria asiatica TaxID=1069075 RepID=A0AAW0RXL9_9HYPO